MRGFRATSGLLALTLALSGALPAAVAADEMDLLEFCLAEPRACALSVHALDEGWERHQNADRPQVLASTFKVLVLLAYAEAVANGDVSPDDTVAKEEWGRYFSGGPSLESSWDEFGNPDDVRLDDLARTMIINSDNSSPDLFLAMLKKKVVKKATKQFDWHDVPDAISSIFGLWLNLNGVGGTGNRLVADYGGFEAVGYQRELAKHAKNLKNDSFVETVRENLCAQPPWVAGPAPCDPAQPFTTEASQRVLTKRFFNRGTTRAYATTMRRLLDGSLLSPAAQEVIDRILDQAWFDRFPTLSPAFSRYGLKGGNLPTSTANNILTWAHYMATSSGRFVVVVFLQDLVESANQPDAADVNAFAQQFALSPSFRQQVRDAIDDEALPTELVPELKKVSLKGRSLTVKAKVFNTSPLKSERPIQVSLYVLDDTEIGGATAVDTVRVSKIKGYKSKSANLKYTADEDLSGKLAVVMIDSGEEIEEQDEANNLTWQRLE